MTLKFSSIFSGLAHFFEGYFQKFIESDAAKQFEAGIVAFIKTDVGAIALDAVSYVATLTPGADSNQLRVAAVAKMKTDLIAAGKDAEAIGESALNLFVEAAYTYSKGTLAGAAAAALKVSKA